MKTILVIIVVLILQIAKATGQFVENVSIHLNQNTFFNTEIIWFNALVINTNQIENQPKNLYVYLISDNDSLIFRKTLKLESGKAYNQFRLHDGIKTGLYQLIAFTEKSAGFTQQYSVQDIVIINPENPQFKTIAKPKPIWQFCPEGGRLIDGMNSRVGVEVKNETLPINAEIINQSGEILASVSVDEKGLGWFSLLPKTGEHYFLQNKQKDINIALPKVEERGYGIRLLNNFETEMIKILVQRQGILNKKDSVTVQIYLNDEQVKNYKVVMPKDLFMLNIPYSQLENSGIFSISVSQDNKQLAQRSTWISKQKNIEPSLEIQKQLLDKEIQLHFLAKTLTQLSISIIDSSLALTKPKPFIENDLQNDLYFLCQKALIDTPIETDFVATDGIVLKGKLINKKSNNISNQEIQGFIGTQWFNGITNQKGEFSTPAMLLYDTATVFLMVKTKKISQDLKLEIQQNLPPTPHYQGINLEFYTWIQRLLQTQNLQSKLNRGIALKEVTIKSKKWSAERKNLMMEFMLNSVEVWGDPTFSFNPNESDPTITIYDVLKKEIKGVQRDCYIPSMESSSGRGFNTQNCICIGRYPCEFYLNGFAQQSCLGDISVEDIKSIDVYFGNFGQLRNVPIVCIYSKGIKYDYSKDKLKAGIYRPRGYGYGVPANFEEEKAKATNESAGIYWNPNVLLKENEKSTINIPITNGKSTYWLDIKGIDANGTSFERILTVK